MKKSARQNREQNAGLTWPGKADAALLADAPSEAVLCPCPWESAGFGGTENIYVEGDNLDALKLLRAEYGGRVKMIYIDPPYNTGKNYIYKNDLFHADWLSMIYPRLKLAKDFLSPDGVFVCAIGERQFPYLALLAKEIFGPESFEHSYVSVVHNPRGQQGINFSRVNEYLIFVYPNDGRKYIADVPKDKVDSRNLRDSGTESDRADARSCFYPFVVKDGAIVEIGGVPEDDFHPADTNVPLPGGAVEVWPVTDGGREKKWRYARQTIGSILSRLEPKMGRKSVQIVFNKKFGTMKSVWSDPRYDASEYGTKLLDNLLGGAPFTYPKSLWAVYDCVKAVTQDDKNALVMDFFSGSATTAHAVMQLNADDGGRRKYIMAQLPEDLAEAAKSVSDPKIKESVESAIKFLDGIGKPRTICEIGKERIRRAGEKIEKISRGIDTGFKVFKLLSFRGSNKS